MPFRLPWNRKKCENIETDDSSLNRSVSRKNIFNVSADEDTEEELECLFPWFWGALSWSQTQKLLYGRPDGTFLMRNSSSVYYLWTLSFREEGATKHCRFNAIGYRSIAKQPQQNYNLITSSLVDNPNDFFIFLQSLLTQPQSILFHRLNNVDSNQAPQPLLLMWPLSRFSFVPTLKHISRLKLRSNLTINQITHLGLPQHILSYLTKSNILVDEDLQIFN